MINTHRFINLLSVIHLDKYVKQDRTNYKAKTGRDRAHTCNLISARYHRCAPEQKAHRRGTIRSMRCLLRKFRAKDAPSQFRQGTQSQESTVNRCTSRTITASIISHPFFFSFTFLQLLQSLDDICAQINPMLWSMIINGR